MLKVLLVDDEAFIRQGLAVLIDWEKEGYYIAGETANGKEAVEFLRKEKVDLIISDIKMPEMNGIELLQMIREEKISTADYILLSGFYEFSYAKSAIRNNCSEYILKPVQKEELIDVVRRIKKRCEQTRIEEDRNREKEKALLDRNLMSLIWGK